MAITSYRGSNGNGNGMQRNESSSDLVAMLQGPCATSPHVGQLQVVAPPLLVGGIEDALAGHKRPFSYEGPTVEDGPGELDGDEGGDELSQGGSHLEKKRRLTFDQVRSLERNFEMENKLEPERKMQLAKELGLRPRQVAVWFQNRRARWKTKQLERDYETLAADYERLKADYEQVLGEKKQLKAEVQRLSNSSSVEPKLEPTETDELEQKFVSRTSPTVDITLANLSKDETVSGSSDVLDADSPRTTVSSSSEGVERAVHGGRSQDSLSSFLGDAAAPLLQVPLEEMPNSSDGDGCFHEFVDQSCNYLLLQLDEQSVLPWWDWP